MAGDISQDEAMANADSPTNMLWLINQATAGEMPGGGGGSDSMGDTTVAQEALARAAPGMDFTNIKIDVTANR